MTLDRLVETRIGSLWRDLPDDDSSWGWGEVTSIYVAVQMPARERWMGSGRRRSLGSVGSEVVRPGIIDHLQRSHQRAYAAALCERKNGSQEREKMGGQERE
jgi:hypothetical protein